MKINANKLLQAIYEAQATVEWHNKEEDKEGYYSFKLETIGKTPMYSLLSEFIHGNLDLSMDTSYEMLGNSLNALEEIIDFKTGNSEEIELDDLTDNINEFADSGTPIYNYDILQFIALNPNIVDSSIRELGKRDSIIEDGQGAYCLAYANFITGILYLLADYAKNN